MKPQANPNSNKPRHWSKFRRMEVLQKKARTNPAVSKLFAHYYAPLEQALIREEGDRDILHDVYLRLTADFPDAFAFYSPRHFEFYSRAIRLFHQLKMSYAKDHEDALRAINALFPANTGEGQEAVKNKEFTLSDEVFVPNEEDSAFSDETSALNDEALLLNDQASDIFTQVPSVSDKEAPATTAPGFLFLLIKRAA